MTRLLNRIEFISMSIAILAVALIMVIISMDAVLRYAFNAPLRWAFELVSYYLMVIGVYFAVSTTFTSGDHISITLLRDVIPPRLRAWIDVVWVSIAAVIFGFMAYGTYHHTISARENVEFIPGIILWPAWLSHLPIPLGCALLVLRLVHHAITLAVTGQDPSVEEHGEPNE